MALVTCLKCAGWGVLVRAAYNPDYGFYLRAKGPGEDITTRRWYPCPNCHGAGELPAWERAEVWRRVADAGIVLKEELRAEGDLDEIPAGPQLDT
jgi:DnaJ-class molecular chaperone